MWLVLKAPVAREVQEAVAGKVTAGVVEDGGSCSGLLQVQGPWRMLGGGELVWAAA